MNIEAGQGFEQIGCAKKSTRYLALGVFDGYVSYIRVEPAVLYDEESGLSYSKVAYDEPGAVFDRDKDNVLLKDCPPPYSAFGKQYGGDNGERKSNAMAIADMRNIMKMPLSYFEKTCHIIDNGAKISDADMYRVHNHPFPVQKEKELHNSRMSDPFVAGLLQGQHANDVELSL